MKRSFLFFSFILILLSACLPTEAVPVIPTPVPSSIPPEIPLSIANTPEAIPALQRGVNLGNMLEAPTEGEWGLRVEERYFDLIRERGFDFVRVPIRWNTHAAESAPYAVDQNFFARVDEITGWALEHGLNVIIDFHHYEELMSDPDGHRERYLAIWRQVASHYRDYPQRVLFELLNEPNSALDASAWNDILVEALAVVRESNPSRDVVIGPVQWNAYDWVSTLDVPEDDHLIVTFHYYLPFEFTHQGADWVGEESNAWLGTTWDGTDEQKEETIDNFDSVSEWAEREHVRILLGEFGAYSKAPQDSRLRWTEFVRSEAERHGFAWAYWEFGAGFGIYDPEANAWREELAQALIP